MIVTALDSYAIPRQTQTAGTAIVAGVPPRPFRRAKLTYLEYINAGTAHTCTIMGCLGVTTVTTAVAAAGTSIILAKDPGVYSTNSEYYDRGITPSTADNAIAANDYFMVQLKDGNWLTATLSAAAVNADGTVTITVSAIPNAGIAAGAKFYFMGVLGDTDPHTNRANPQISLLASVTNSFPAASAGQGAVVAQAYHLGYPLIVHINNITAAGTLTQGSVTYSDR